MGNQSNKSNHGTSQTRARKAMQKAPIEISGNHSSSRDYGRKLSGNREMGSNRGSRENNDQATARENNDQATARETKAQSAVREIKAQVPVREIKGQLEHLAQQAGDMASKATKVTSQAVSNATRATGDALSKAGHAAMETISANPIPIAIAGLGVAATGIGITWLMLSGTSSAAEGASTNGASTRRASMRGASSNASSSNALSEGVQAAKEVAQNAKEVAQNAGTQVADMAQRAGKQALRLEQRLEDVVKQHPVAAGATLLAVGAAIGLAIPRSALEDTWLGRERDLLFAATRRFAQSTWEKVEDVAHAVAPSITSGSSESAQA